MHVDNLEAHSHSHSFVGDSEGANARKTLLVVMLTGVTMVVEIVAGWITGSMALLADGWHMSSHFLALGLASFAYWFARRHAASRAFTFGTGKVNSLAAFASAISLALISLLMVYESVSRLLNPVAIEFNAAISVALLGLIVNVVSAVILMDRHDHGHGNAHHKDHHHDHNLRAAYIHVLADALTSLLAIGALVGGAFLGWKWLDPVMGIVGAVIILVWSRGLLTSSANILLDREFSQHYADVIQRALEDETDNRVADLHLWQLGTGHLALIVSVVTHHPRSPQHYKALIAECSVPALSHVTVEVISCPEVSLRAA